MSDGLTVKLWSEYFVTCFSLIPVNLILTELRSASKHTANLSLLNSLCNLLENGLHEAESLQSSMKAEASYLIFWMSALASKYTNVSLSYMCFQK